MPCHSFLIALGTVTFVATLGGSALAADPEPSAQARTHFRAGVEHLRSRRYSDAYREFKASHAATPTWKVLGNIGIAADKLERDGEAIDALQKYLDEGQEDVNAREASQARDDLARLRRGIATVTIVAPGPFWIVDTRVNADGPVVNQYGPFDGSAELRVRAGEHEFKLERTSIEASMWRVKLLPGDRGSHRFEIPSEMTGDVEEPIATPTPEVDAAPASHLSAYVAWGAGALAAGVSAVLYFEARSLQREANSAFAESCPNGADRSDFRCANALADDTEAANWRTAALLTGAGALGALITGTALYLLDEPSAPAEASEASIQPWVGPYRIGITGTF